MTTYNDKWEEIPDKTPMALPIGYERPESLESMIARMIQSHSFQEAALKNNVESFEESDDFDIDDDSEIVSEYQMNDMQEETPYVRKQHTATERRTRETTSEEPKEKPTQETVAPAEKVVA